MYYEQGKSLRVDLNKESPKHSRGDMFTSERPVFQIRTVPGMCDQAKAHYKLLIDCHSELWHNSCINVYF